ncbi:hypothetical protein P154DRAFT_518607, partial [Amniculicola lignicola CBS 123094]
MDDSAGCLMAPIRRTPILIGSVIAAMGRIFQNWSRLTVHLQGWALSSRSAKHHNTTKSHHFDDASL